MIATWVTWLLAIYGLAAILIQFFKKMNKYYDQVATLQVKLLVYNSETCLEGAVRSLANLSRLDGRPIQMLVYDFGSTDSTAEILYNLEKDHPFLFQHIDVITTEIQPYSLVSMEDKIGQSSVIIDLRQNLRGAELSIT